MVTFFKKFIFSITLFLVIVHQLPADQEDVLCSTNRITIAEYCCFLNKVAPSDSYHLYDPKMECDPPMIWRYGPPGKYRYKPVPGSENNEITYVNRLSQARFWNWKENGKKHDGTEKGVYDLTLLKDPIDAFEFDFLPEANTQWHLSANNKVDPMLRVGPNEESLNDLLNGIEKESDAFFGATDPFIGGKLEESASLNLSSSLTSLQLLASPQPASPFSIHYQYHYNSKKNTYDTFSLVSITPTNQIKMITIDDPNNIGDYKFACIGSVKKIFQIQETDVTAQQYCIFLNVVATDGDPYQFYDPRMGSDTNIACITREGTNAPYSYRVIPDREQFPITYVRADMAAAFCNWMENLEDNKPINGEESVLSGAFDITYSYEKKIGSARDAMGRPIATSTLSRINVERNTNSRWSLPTEDQWYKAAYYRPAQKNKGGFEIKDNPSYYYHYGTASDSLPENSVDGRWTSANSANFCLVDEVGQLHYTTINPPHITPVGFFKKTKSPFGLYDMSGNVDQWVMFERAEICWGFNLRGGSWNSRHDSFLPLKGVTEIDTGEIGVTSLRRVQTNIVEINGIKTEGLLRINPGLATNTVGFRLVYNVEPPVRPEAFYQKAGDAISLLGARLGYGLCVTWDAFINYRFHCVDSTMEFINWVFPNLILPRLLVELLNQAIGVRGTNKTLMDELIIKPLTAAIRGIISPTSTHLVVRNPNIRAAGTGAPVPRTTRFFAFRTTTTQGASVTEGVLGETTAAGLEGEAETAALVLPPPWDIVVPLAILGGGIACAYYAKDVRNAMGGFGMALSGLLQIPLRILSL